MIWYDAWFGCNRPVMERFEPCSSSNCLFFANDWVRFFHLDFRFSNMWESSSHYVQDVTYTFAFDTLWSSLWGLNLGIVPNVLKSLSSIQLPYLTPRTSSNIKNNNPNKYWNPFFAKYYLRTLLNSFLSCCSFLFFSSILTVIKGCHWRCPYI